MDVDFQEGSRVVRLYNLNVTRGQLEDEIFDYSEGKPFALFKRLGLSLPCPLAAFAEKTALRIEDKKSREEYIHYFNQEHLISEFEKNNFNLSFEYSVFSSEDNLVHKIQHTMLLQKDKKSNEVIALCSALDLTGESFSKKQAALAQKKADVSHSVIEALMKDFYSIWLVNKNDWSMHLFKSTDALAIKAAVDMLQEVADYNRGMVAYVNKYVLAHEREKILMETIPGLVSQRLKEEGTYAVNFTRLNEDGTTNFHQIIFADSCTDEFVMAFRSVDALVKSQIEKVSNEMKLKQYEADFMSMELIYEALGSGSWGMTFDKDSKMLSSFYSQSFRNMLGYKNSEDFPDEFESWTNLIYEEDKDRVLNAYWDCVKNEKDKKSFDVEYRLYTKTRGLRWFHMLGCLSRREDFSPEKFVGLFTDIQSKKDSQKRLVEQWKIVEALSSNYLNVYKVNVKERSVVIIKLKGYANLEIEGSENPQTYSYDEMMARYVKEKVYVEDVEASLKSLNLDFVKDRLSENKEYLYSYRGMSGNEMHYYQFRFIRLQKEYDQDETIIVSLKNIDATVKAERERVSLIYLSETDQMTGLLNRISGQNKTIAELAKHDGGIFIIMDINHFKIFNDTFGHSTGDKVIIEFARAIKEVFRGNDIKFRLGGDEFAIFISGNSKREVAESLIKRFSSRLENLNIAEIDDTPVYASIGVGLVPVKNRIEFQKLYRRVDAAVYQSKKDSGKTVATFVEF